MSPSSSEVAIRFALPDRLAPEMLEIDGHDLTIEDVVAVARYRRRVRIASGAARSVERCRRMVDILIEKGQKVYGLNTGFGKLRDVLIDPEKLAALQVNLIRSHASGTGEPFQEDVVRAAMLLRANTLCRGHSGIRLSTVQALVGMLNEDVFPYVPQKGSVGASGDLAPLSHLTLALMGDPGGRFYPRERRSDGGRPVLTAGVRAEDFVPMPDKHRWTERAGSEGWREFRAVDLEAKEGLALNNGTTFMTAVASLAVYDCFFLLRTAELAAAASLEAIGGTKDAYDERIHEVRPHPYQGAVARRVRAYCTGSEILDVQLNSAHLSRARQHLSDAGARLGDLTNDLERDVVECPATVSGLRRDIERLQGRIAALIPTDAADSSRVDRAKARKWAASSKRKQIEELGKAIDPLRRDAASLLQVAQQPSFPSRDTTPKVRSALVAVVDQLNKAVPEAPEVQDDYSFRCFPQVLACAWRALDHVHGVVSVEINAATDNPLLFPKPPDEVASADDYGAWLLADPTRLEDGSNAVLGGGNFHGQPISVVMDYLAIAMTTVGSIAERRVAHLVDANHSRGLPAFLIRDSGLNSGFMIPQYTAAALVSENKILSHPASVDSIPTCANTEDHVSMGTIAARKARQVVENTKTVLAIELLAACGALIFRRPLRPGPAVDRVADLVFEVLPWDRPFEVDDVMYVGIDAVRALLGEARFLACLGDV